MPERTMSPTTEQDYQQIIRQQAQIIRQQQRRIAELEKKVQELSAQVARLSKNSSNLVRGGSPDPPRRNCPPRRHKAGARRVGDPPRPSACAFFCSSSSHFGLGTWSLKP